MAQEQTKQPKSPRTLSEFREFTANNPKIVTLQNGEILRMLSEIEWIDIAKRHNQDDAFESQKSSLMSGYVIADSGSLLMQKVGTNVKYKVTED